MSSQVIHRMFGRGVSAACTVVGAKAISSAPERRACQRMRGTLSQEKRLLTMIGFRWPVRLLILRPTGSGLGRRRVVDDLDGHLIAEILLAGAVERFPVADPERIQSGVGRKLRRYRLARQQAARMAGDDSEDLVQ